MLAAILLTYLPEQLRAFEDWRLVIYALLLIVMMLVRPEGLLGNRELWKRRKTAVPPRRRTAVVVAAITAAWMAKRRRSPMMS